MFLVTKNSWIHFVFSKLFERKWNLGNKIKKIEEVFFFIFLSLNLEKKGVPLLWKHNSVKQNTQSLNISQFPHNVLQTSEIKIYRNVYCFCAKQNKALRKLLSGFTKWEVIYLRVVQEEEDLLTPDKFWTLLHIFHTSIRRFVSVKDIVSPEACWWFFLLKKASLLLPVA